MSNPHLERAQQQVLLILRRSQARGRMAIPLTELVRTALHAHDPIDGVLAEAIDDLRQRGRIVDHGGSYSLV